MSTWNTPDYYEQVSGRSIYDNPSYAYSFFNQGDGRYSDYDAEVSQIRTAQAVIFRQKYNSAQHKNIDNITVIDNSVTENQREDSYRFLVRERDSLYQRINFADSISSLLNSTLVRDFSQALRGKMLDLASDISENIEVSGLHVHCDLLSSDDKIKANQVFILHILDIIRKALSNASAVSEKEIQIMVSDICLLISQYYSGKNQTNGNIPKWNSKPREIIDFFDNETGYKATVCSNCGRATTLFFKKCLHCGGRIAE